MNVSQVNEVLSEIFVDKGKTTNLSYRATFWKTKERFPAASLLSCKNQRRHKSLRILPRNVVGENPRYNRTNKQYTPAVGN